MTVTRTDVHPPLTDNLVTGGVENTSLSLGIKPYAVAFIIF
jgi:hypothetical protein